MHRAQLALGGGHLIATDQPSPGPARSMILVRVADVDAHCRRAEEARARIVARPSHALSLVLALALPADLIDRPLLVALTAGTVMMLSLVSQGESMGLAPRRLGLGATAAPRNGHSV